MSLAKRLLNNPGLIALTTPDEQAEVGAVTNKTKAPLRLQYLRGSREKGLRLWNLLSPQLPEYVTNGKLNGYPTFSLPTLQEKGLLA